MAGCRYVHVHAAHRHAVTGRRQIRFENEREIRHALDKAADELEDMTDAHKHVASLIERRARLNAPVRTGKLRASIGSVSSSDGAAVTSSLVYAPYVEYGSIHVSARHYAGNAIDQSQGEIVKEYERGADKICERAERVTK